MNPPKLAQLILRWFDGGADLEDIRGDLDEVYDADRQEHGKWSADAAYWRHVLSIVLSYALRKRKSDAKYSYYYFQNTVTMLRNYFKIAYRNLKKQKVFTIINVVGLAIGMSIALLSIAMYLELSQFDEFHPDASNTFRMTTKVIESGDVVHYASAPPALMYKMDEQVEGITGVHISDSFFPTLLHNENEIETWGYYTQRDFFKIFDFPIAAGSPEALDHPNQIILTQELSQKLFKDESAIGKVIETKKDGSLVVAGVLKAFPKRTHFQFDFLIGLSSSPQFSAGSAVTNWTQFKGHYYYFNIQQDRTEEIVSLVSKLGETGDSHFQVDGKEVKYQLQPLSKITPGEMLSDTIGLEFDRATMIFFFGLGLLILIPACFNYTNMSIAVALKRSKEVGIRKVMGSHHKQIMGQFLVETVIICLLAVSLSAIIFHFIKLEFVSMLTGASAIDLSLSIWLILAFVLFAVITGLITGIAVSYTHLRAHETKANLVCRLLLEKKKMTNTISNMTLMLHVNTT